MDANAASPASVVAASATPIVIKSGPSWTTVILLVAVVGMAGFIISEKMHGTGSNDSSPSRKADESVVRLGKESMVAAQKAPYEAVLQASSLDLDSTAEYAAMIHSTLNKRYEAAWTKWSDEMTSRFGATSSDKLPPTKKQDLRDYLSDLATGIKASIK